MIGDTVRSLTLGEGDLINVESANRLRDDLLLEVEVVSVDFEKFWAFLEVATISYYLFCFFVGLQKLDLEPAHSFFDKL